MTTGLLIALLLSSVLAAGGQILLKAGATGSSSLHDFINGYVISGLFAYGLGVLLWLYGLSKAPLYAVYPFTLLTFVFVGAASLIVFREDPHPISILGWAVIGLGIGFVYYGTMLE
jgi:drug/metabolite transporter (DMT)-like permease